MENSSALSSDRLTARWRGDRNVPGSFHPPTPAGLPSTPSELTVMSSIPFGVERICNRIIFRNCQEPNQSGEFAIELHRYSTMPRLVRDTN